MQYLGANTDKSSIVCWWNQLTVAVPFTGSVIFPSIPLRSSSVDDNLSDPTEAYFGAQFTRASGSVIFDESNLDVLYSLPKGAGGADGFGEVANTTETSWYFSLDDLRMDASADKPAYYSSGSRERSFDYSYIWFLQECS